MSYHKCVNVNNEPSQMADCTAAVVRDGDTETKVQVDRRKLEAMITGESAGEAAAAFFARVERSSGAQVCWPSRLKIRAKTKKDPFVKLIGTPHSVQKAAQMIAAHLRVKREKATLKIEMSHSLHSQIIGRGGKNTQQIMHETNCHVHFPDSNKLPAVATIAQSTQKNDQVSISGCAKDVERAREMLRAVCPVAVSVSIQLAVTRSLQSIQPCLDPAQLQRHFPPNGSGEQPSVQFISQGPPLLGQLHFLMRSSAQNELEMLRSFGRVCQLIGVFPTGAELMCSSQLELRPATLPSLSSVRWIAFRTNTQIHLNDRGLLIAGSLEGIFVARKFLTGLLPVSLHFERPRELSAPSSAVLRAMEAELDVQVGERRRKKGTKGAADEEWDFVICTYEANLFGAYMARNRLLKEESLEKFPQDTECAAFMRSVCRESLLADQQSPLNNATFATSNRSAFAESKHCDKSMNWRTDDDGTDIGEKPKSPDPKESPIAAGLLAGVKNVNSQKGEFQKALDRERMLLKANRAIYNSPLAEFGQEDNNGRSPTDFWSGYGFSNSLPTELLRLGRLGGICSEDIVGGEGIKQQYQELRPQRGRPIMGRGHVDKEQQQQDESLFGRSSASPLSRSAKMSGGLRSSASGAQLMSVREDEELGDEPNRRIIVHPRVAALQMGEQRRKPKFALSTSSGLFDAYSPGGNSFDQNGGRMGDSPFLQQMAEQDAPLPAAAAPIWDIRVLREPALVLAQLGLAEHVAFFREQEIDMQAFLLLDEPCLRTLGVSTLGARHKIMHAIMKLRDSARRHGLYSL